MDTSSFTEIRHEEIGELRIEWSADNEQSSDLSWVVKQEGKKLENLCMLYDNVEISSKDRIIKNGLYDVFQRRFLDIKMMKNSWFLEN